MVWDGKNVKYGAVVSHIANKVAIEVWKVQRRIGREVIEPDLIPL